MRRQLIDALLPYIKQFCTALLPGIDITLRYRQGWKSDLTLSSALEQSFAQDTKQQFTSVGPHRADLLVTHNSKRVVETFSRGQLKLLLCCFRLAQMSLLKALSGKSSLVLLDDLPAELDASHRRLLLSLLHDLDNQVFITATDRLDLDCSSWKDLKVFHVEHGEIEEVV